MTHDMGELLLRDLRQLTAALQSLDGPLPASRPQVSAFSH
jgi:hypothetical protein